MEEFIDYALIVIGALVYKLFTSIVSIKSNNEASDEPILYMQRGDITASGVRTSEGFAVLKGSKLSLTLVKNCPENARKYRKQYESKIDKNFVLLEDVLVSSPSAAAAFVGGVSISGNEAWKTKDGISIKKM